MMIVLVIAGGVVLLGVYVFLRHGDGVAAIAAGVLAAAAIGSWFLAARQRDQLAEELRASEARVAELEKAPPQRGFAPDARADLVEALSNFVGPTAFVLANSADAETSDYAREIGSILNDAGWEVPPSFGMMYRPVLLPGQEAVPPGLILGVSDDVADTFEMAIYNAFNEAGVDIRIGPHWPGTEHPISILVGPSR
jgi:hypothetical protein